MFVPRLRPFRLRIALATSLLYAVAALPLT